MTDTGIFTTNTEVGYKAGARKSTVSSAETYTNNFIAQAESFINVACDYNFSDVYSILNNDVKYILKEAASNLAAIYVINYDLSGTTMTSLQRIDAEDMINVLYKRAMDCIELLKNQDHKKFLQTA